MTPEQWQRVEEIFHEAITLPSDEREGLARSRSGPDGEVCLEVLALLRAHERSGLLDQGAGELAVSWLQASAREPAPGLYVGQYEIIAKIGSGGMGSVFKARDTRLNRHVALKFLTGTVRDDADRVGRIEQEARAASALNHPNLMTVHDAGSADGFQYIACEFVDGVTVREKLRSGNMPLQEVLSITSQVAAAAEAAHEAGIVHGDIKPENIMVRPDGLVKVLDFGVATTGSPLHDGAYARGTPRYMAPEQRDGSAPGPPADIYSLGVMLREMATGDKSRDNRDVPASLHAVILKCTASDPGLRFGSARELRVALERIAASDGRRTNARVAAVAAAAVVILALAFVWTRARPRGLSSVAVLPIADLSGDPENVWFADAITGQLITALSNVQSLRVTSRISVAQYRGRPKPVQEIGRELNVDAVVEGSVAESNGEVKLAARLVRASDEKVLWSKAWSQKAAQVRTIESELVRDVAAHLGAVLTPAEEQRIRRISSVVDPALHSLFLKGRLLANDTPSPENMRRGIALLHTALDKDPSNAEAWAGIAEGWFGLANIYIAPAEAVPHARTACARSIQLDPESDAPYAVLGKIQLFYDWDWAAAEASLNRALNLNPSSYPAYEGLACLQTALGKPDDAIQAARRAVQLNPLSLFGRFVLAMIYADSRRYEEAIETAQRTLEMEPKFGLVRSILGVARSMRGEHPQAVREFETAAQSQRNTTTLGLLAYGYGAAGRRREAERTLSELVALSRKQYVCPFEVATGYGSIGRLDEAFEWMHKGLKARADCMVWMRSEPWLDVMRSDARYAALVKQIGFPPAQKF